jgi:hypothetical protein
MSLTTKMEMLNYYTAPGVHTDASEFSDMLANLPSDVPGLVQVVQGSLLHVFWAERYGRKLNEEEKATLNIRPVAEKLAIMQAVDPASLIHPRPLELRQVGNCRDFSILLCSLLRFEGIPARARCGFGTYFLPDHYEDHWVCEYWKTAEERWVMVDAQLDAFQRQTLEIDFDSLDMPPGRFVPAGQAYQMCRQGKADPNAFGIFDMHGLDFIQGNVVRDYLALNKYEILPWDWGSGYLTEASFADLAFFDYLAALLVAGDESFTTLRTLYENDPPR